MAERDYDKVTEQTIAFYNIQENTGDQTDTN